MGKKCVGYSKRKRKACFIELCKNMTKKRKKLLEQSSESTVMESSLNLSENKSMTFDFTEQKQDHNSPIYTELQNVLPTSADKNNKHLPRNIESMFKLTTEKKAKNSASPDIALDCAPEAARQNQCKEKSINGDIIINQKSDWYFQIQGQLHICKMKYSLLGIWYGDNKIKTEFIEKDDKFWTDVMERKLLKFYYDCLLPELVDPRHIRNKPIRDPEYVIGNSNENTDPNITHNSVSGVDEVANAATSNIVIPFSKY